MAETWKNEHGLDPNDPSDGMIVSLSADDYTSLEMYLNELAGDPVEYIVIASDSSASKIGDVNADGEFSVADLVAMQKWLLGTPNAELADWQWRSLRGRQT